MSDDENGFDLIDGGDEEDNGIDFDNALND